MFYLDIFMRLNAFLWEVFDTHTFEDLQMFVEEIANILCQFRVWEFCYEFLSARFLIGGCIHFQIVFYAFKKLVAW